MLEQHQVKCTCCYDYGYILETNKSSFLIADYCQACTPEWELRQEIDQTVFRYNTARIPARFGKGDQLQVFQAEIQKWLDTPKDNLFFYGLPNTKKTSTAINVLFRLIENGYTVCYVDCTSYLNELRSVYSNNTQVKIKEHHIKQIEQYKQAVLRYDIIVFDNVGNGNLTPWGIEQYDNLITTRHSTGRPTIFISNYCDDSLYTYEKNTLTQKIGTRSASRVLAAKKIEFNEPSKEAKIIDFADIAKIRNIKEETTFLHIWAREGLFRLISKNERGRLSQKSKIDQNQIIEKTDIYEYISWSGYHIIMDGPVLDYYDANILAILMHIYHKHGFNNGIITTTLNEISCLMGVERNSNTNTAIKRSLIRLSKCRPTIKKSIENDSEHLWVGGFIDSIEIVGKARASKVMIQLNRSMVPLYQKNAFAFISVPILVNFSQYAQGIYRFLTSHKDSYKYIGLEKWKSILGVTSDIDIAWFKRSMKNALKELIERNVLDVRSHIDTTNTVHTYVKSETV